MHVDRDALGGQRELNSLGLGLQRDGHTLVVAHRDGASTLTHCGASADGDVVPVEIGNATQILDPAHGVDLREAELSQTNFSDGEGNTDCPRKRAFRLPN